MLNPLQGNATPEDYRRMVEIKGKEPLNPIGSCFDASAFQIVFTKTGRFKGMKLCHGVIQANAPGSEGKEVPHAWIEAKDTDGSNVVLDAIWGEIIPKQVFYNKFKPTHIFSYTQSRVLTLWALHDHPGPWHKTLIDKFEELGVKVGK